MDEHCKYCKTSNTCLENAEYNSIYCQLHKRIPKVIGKTYEELQQENQQLKEQLKQKEDIINKARKYINNNPLYDIDGYENNRYLSGIDDEQTRKELLEILDNKGE